MGSSYDLLRDGRVVAEGAAKIVWIDLATGRSAPLPDVIVAPLQAAADGAPDGTCVLAAAQLRGAVLQPRGDRAARRRRARIRVRRR